jgi:hypothetical protein
VHFDVVFGRVVADVAMDQPFPALLSRGTEIADFGSNVFNIFPRFRCRDSRTGFLLIKSSKLINSLSPLTELLRFIQEPPAAERCPLP